MCFQKKHIYIYINIYIYIRRLLGVSRKEKSLDPKDRERPRGIFRARASQAGPGRARPPHSVRDAPKTHPYRRIRPSDVQNASVALIFESRNAPLSRISPLGCPKCERGAHFCIPKRTPITDFAIRTSKMRAWCSFLHCQTHPYRRFR